ncbi:hypothetical protein B0T10DRAFT_567751 [Thelonectria olida]|uniref:Uncharacterized protein n=1 Tax=Thelonectria olida TaxID=1576542 RepID=A0A9P9AJC2_9HYPO|nr:hypothetical protein B0T10DRAFT_567751 [Thelonectria olida]
MVDPALEIGPKYLINHELYFYEDFKLVEGFKKMWFGKFIINCNGKYDQAPPRNVNPADAKIPTSNYFVPKSFRCNMSPKSAFSGGTMNYSMMTHRAKEPP